MFNWGSKGEKKAGAQQAPAKKPVTRPAAPSAGAARPGQKPQAASGASPARPTTSPRPTAARADGTTPQALPRVAARVVPREPTEAERQSILDFQGRVLTADGGAIEITPSQRLVIAALDNGSLLVAKAEAASAQVSSVRELLRQNKYIPSAIYLMDREAIRIVYENESRRTGLRSGHADMERMQKAVMDLIRTAASLKCSDIHITVDRYEAQVRVRSDGVMMPLRDLNAASAMDLLQAAFYMADASDAQYKIYDYQGARISTAGNYSLPEGVQAVRLQYNPLPDGGRYLIARLLYQQKILGNEDVDNLGYSQHQIRQIKRMRDKPHGIVVISGPTGSGKSTTLQTALQATAREKNYEVNIITVEDPPEYLIKGAAQLPVVNVKTEEERHEAFRAAIAASLRSDPDIIMIGEIRDSASASLAFQAAMTGHQVWASLHANDALSILDRLRDNKVETYKLSDPSLVIGLIGQRLVRRLCDHCKMTLSEGHKRGVVSDTLYDDIRRLLPDHHEKVCVANPDGCDHCDHRGNRGRTVVAETILPDREFMALIANEKKHEAFQHWLAKLDGMTMVEHALWKTASGLIDPREIGSKVGTVDEASPERMTLVFQGESAPQIASSSSVAPQLPSSVGESS